MNRKLVHLCLVFACVLAACQSASSSAAVGPSSGQPTPTLATSGQPTPTLATSGQPTPTLATQTQAPSVAAQVRYTTGSTKKICQLTGDTDRELNQPTLNQTYSRYGVSGTDLGSSFEYDGKLYLLFGDTVGTHGGKSIAFTADTDPDNCLSLRFVTGPDGLYLPPTVPGISLAPYDVPVSGFGAQGNMYVVFTTDWNAQEQKMGRSVLTRSRDNAQHFTYLYDLSTDKFINVASVIVNNADIPGLPATTGQGLLLWGSGYYRRSDPYLAYLPLNAVEDAKALRYFAGTDGSGTPRWSTQESAAVSLFSQPCLGELSVAWNSYLRKWLMLYNCTQPRGINFRTADSPWGPWSPTQVLFDPWTDGGYCHFMHVSYESQHCDSVSDPGQEDEWGGEYGPYMLPAFFTGSGNATTIYFTMSTWNPYEVMLMKSTLVIAT